MPTLRASPHRSSCRWVHLSRQACPGCCRCTPASPAPPCARRRAGESASRSLRRWCWWTGAAARVGGPGQPKTLRALPALSVWRYTLACPTARTRAVLRRWGWAERAQWVTGWGGGLAQAASSYKECEALIDAARDAAGDVAFFGAMCPAGPAPLPRPRGRRAGRRRASRGAPRALSVRARPGPGGGCWRARRVLGCP